MCALLQLLLSATKKLSQQENATCVRFVPARNLKIGEMRSGHGQKRRETHVRLFFWFQAPSIVLVFLLLRAWDVHAWLHGCSCWIRYTHYCKAQNFFGCGKTWRSKDVLNCTNKQRTLSSPFFAFVPFAPSHACSLTNVPACPTTDGTDQGGQQKRLSTQ